MDSGLEGKLLEECTCSICFDTFQDPVKLSCQHSFCKTCISAFAKSKPTREIKCPICSAVILLPAQGDVSQLPTDFMARRIVDLLQSHKVSQTLQNVQLDPQTMANASAPPMDDSVSNPIIFQEPLPSYPASSPIYPASSPSPAYYSPQSSPSAPPPVGYEGYPPPPSTLQYPPSYAGQPSPSYPPLAFHLASSSPSGFPPHLHTMDPPPMSSSQPPPMHLFDPPPKNNNHNNGSSYSWTVSQQAASSSSAAGSSTSMVQTSYPPPVQQQQSSSQQVVLPDESSALGLPPRHGLPPPIPLPGGMRPPNSILTNECIPMFDVETISMPYIIQPGEIQSRWREWMQSLWFASMRAASFHGYKHYLCPAWRVAGDVTIHFTGIASVRAQAKNSKAITVERHNVSRSLRLPTFSVLYSGASDNVTFAHLLKLCNITDQLPSGEAPGFFKQLLGAKAEHKKMSEFPAPVGERLPRSPAWYAGWQEAVSNLENDSCVADIIKQTVQRTPGFSTAELRIDSVSVVGFHTLFLTPFEFPVYLGEYTHPNYEKPFIFVMNGQDGKIHDGTQRPMSTFGSLLKTVLPAAFSK